MKDSRRIFTIAEVGINFNGEFDNCTRLIDMAAEAGCDSVKFQLFTAKNLYPKSAGKLDWRDNEKSYSYNIYDAVKSTELPRDWVAPLINYCRDNGVEFLCSVFHKTDLAFLIKHDVARLKISSSSLTNLPFLEHCAQTGRKIILSTGGGRLSDVERAVDLITGINSELTLLHCNLQYPTPLDKCNLAMIQTYSQIFPEAVIGYSDHTEDPVAAPLVAAELGAKIIEKHITLDKSMPGPDHFFALDKVGLRRMVETLRKWEADSKLPEGIDVIAMKGDPRNRISSKEKYLRDFVKNQIFARCDIPAGDQIHPADLIILRRGKKDKGFEPEMIKLFTEFTITSKKDISAETPISWNQILT